nr:mabinlin II chain A - Yunnan caper (fragments) [Capparis masaikai]
CQRACQR